MAQFLISPHAILLALKDQPVALHNAYTTSLMLLLARALCVPKKKRMNGGKKEEVATQT